MVKTILLDDEERGLKVLEHLCNQSGKVEIIGKYNDAEEAILQINKLKPQLVILDINMPKYNGFEVIKNINYKEYKVIFVTAHNEYAIKAFQYSAANYLLKPVDDDLFIQAIETIVKSLENNEFNDQLHTIIHNFQSMNNPMAMKICVPNVNGFSVVDAHQILYCEADSCYTIFKLHDGRQIISSKTLQEYENVLDENIFMRIHRSFIINLSHIKEYHKGSGGSVIMNNGAELEVSRRKKDEFLQKMKSMFR